MHVLHYLILRYHPTRLGPNLQGFVESFFGAYEVYHGILYGGFTKWQLLEAGNWAPYKVVNNEPLQILVNGLATLCHNQYRLKSSFVEEMISEYTHPFLKSSEEEPTVGGIGDDSEPFQYEGDRKVTGGRPNMGASSSSSPAHAHPTSSSNRSLDDNLQDHTSLALLLASVRMLPWKVRRFGLGGDKAMNKFDFQDKNRGSAFSSNFSTSEYFDLASAGPSKALLSRQNK